MGADVGFERIMDEVEIDMEDLIRRSDAIKAVWGDDINPSEDGMVYEAQSHIDRDIRLIPSADRPSGEVDAVKEYERQVHNLNQGYITLGEFDKRVEPLSHLYYDRPQGEWVKDNLGTVICSECKRPRRDNRVNHINFCNSCGARMKGAEDVG